MVPGESIPQSNPHAEQAEKLVPYPKDDYTIVLKDEEVTPVFEPKVRGGTVVGYELLLRERLSRRTYGNKVEAAELAGNGDMRDIVRATFGVADQVITQAMEQTIEPARIAVNIPPRELEGRSLDLLRAYALKDPTKVSYIELEITERQPMTPAHIERLRALRGMGYRITLDDCDTQHRPLKELLTNEALRDVVDTIKLDKKPTTQDSAELRDILTTLHVTYFKHIVIEGVEDEAALELCDSKHATQGYVHGREPLTAQQALDAMREATRRMNVTSVPE